MNLHRIDLNLFAVFDAIYTAGSLTRAADVLCITQPAVSNSLARLRDMLNDPLFVRTGHSMTPTPVAQNIIVPARAALELLRKSVQESHTFDPLIAEKQFNLLAHLEDGSPNITLANFEISRSKVVSEMANGNLDFFADASTFTDPHLHKACIATDRYVVLARKNHPKLKNGLNLETFLNMNHINVTYRHDGSSAVDVVLDNLGHKRCIKFHSQHFLTVPSALVKTDMVACMPYHLAKHYDLAMYEMPIDMPAMEYFLYWHVSMNEDHAHRWMREQIMEVAKAYHHV
jgi:DNA-binding transcriptional LysR family regulator